MTKNHNVCRFLKHDQSMIIKNYMMQSIKISLELILLHKDLNFFYKHHYAIILEKFWIFTIALLHNMMQSYMNHFEQLSLSISFYLYHYPYLYLFISKYDAISNLHFSILNLSSNLFHQVSTNAMCTMVKSHVLTFFF